MEYFLENLTEIPKFTRTAIYLYIEWFVLLITPKKPKSLKGEIILITGSANGLGKETCKKLAPLGATLVLWDIDKKENEATAAELRNLGVTTVFTDTVDMSKRSEIVAAAAKLRQNIGPVTILYNNAGIASVKPFLKLNPDTIRKVFDINVLAHFWTLQEFLPDMLAKNKGHVVTMCSMMAHMAFRGSPPYFSSKHALDAFIECVKDELYFNDENCKIKFTTIYPHFTKTNLTEGDQAGFKISMKMPWIAPFMEVDWVTQKIVEGILYEKEYIYLPNHFRMYLAAKFLIPRKLQSALQNWTTSVEFIDSSSKDADGDGNKINKQTQVASPSSLHLLAKG